MVEITDREMSVVRFHERRVCSYFGVSLDKIYGGYSRREVSTARNFLYYFLHCKEHISVGKLSLLYGRCTRSVKKQIAATKFCIERYELYSKIARNIEKATP